MLIFDIIIFLFCSLCFYCYAAGCILSGK